MAQENLGVSQHRQKQNYDTCTRERNLRVGDWVLVLLPDNRHKLLSQCQGLVRIPRGLGPINYEVQRTQSVRKRQIYHINLLKKWNGREAWLIQEDVGDLNEVGAPMISEWEPREPRIRDGLSAG